jgi:hypothetical protein
VDLRGKARGDVTEIRSGARDSRLAYLKAIEEIGLNKMKVLGGFDVSIIIHAQLKY